MARVLRAAALCVLVLALVLPAGAIAQIATGAIAGAVSDSSGAVLPGVTVSLSGERLIGGTQTQTTDSAGAYRAHAASQTNNVATRSVRIPCRIGLQTWR